MLHYQEIRDVTTPLGQKQLNDTLRDLWNKSTGIGSRDIIDGAIDDKKIKEDSIEARHIRANAIESDHIRAEQIRAKHLIAGEIDTQHIKAMAITSYLLDADSIEARHISSLAIETRHLQSDAITTRHIEAGAITAESGILSDLSVTSAKIAQAAIKSAHIDDAQIKTAHIDDAQITSAKIADAQILSAHIEAAQIKTGHIEHGSINTAHIIDGAITSAKILDGSIGTAHISELKADLLTSGIIDTSAVIIRDEEGRLIISDNRLQILDYDSSDNLFERVLLGNLGDNNYGLKIRGSDGETVLLNEDGLTELGFTNGYSKLPDNSLNPIKIDIDSVITRINEDGTSTIEGSKILLNNKTLDVEIFDINTKQSELETTTSNNTASITANTEAINLKLNSQTFDNYKTETDGEIDSINTNLQTKTTEISALQGQIVLKAEQTDLESLETITNGISSNVDSLQTQTSGITIELGSIDTRVGNIETEIITIDDIITNHNTRLTSAEQKITDDAIISTVSQTILDAKSDVLSYTDTRYSQLEQTHDGFVSTVANTYASKEDIETIGTRNYILSSDGTEYDIQGDYEEHESDDGDEGDDPTEPTEQEGFFIDEIETSITYGNFTVQNPMQNPPELTGYKDLLGKRYLLSEQLAENTWYTLSLTGEIGESNILGVWLGEDSFIGFIQDGKISFKLNEENENETLVLKSITEEGNIEKIKLEKGKIATDWSPAPEDISVSFTEFIQDSRGFKFVVKSSFVSQDDFEDRMRNTLDSDDYADIGSQIASVATSLSELPTSEDFQGLSGKYDTVDGKIDQITTDLANYLPSSTFTTWTGTYQEMITKSSTDSTNALNSVQTLGQRVSGIEFDLEDTKATWKFLSTRAELGEEGLFIGTEDKRSGIFIGKIDEGEGPNQKWRPIIKFISDDDSVAQISEGALSIEKGIFTEEATIGVHQIKPLDLDGDITIFHYVGGEN